jgi:hypothetical protein
MEEPEIKTTTEFEPARFFESFIGVARELIIRPRLFYQKLPTSGSLQSPLLFLLTNSFLTALFVANYRGASYQMFVALMGANIFSALAAGALLHIVAVRLVKSPAGLGATVRIIAYASIVDIASWIPVVGPLPYCYGLYLIFLGLQEIHRMTPRQAGGTIMAIVLIITILFTGMVLVAPEGIQEAIKLMDPQQVEN